MMAKIGIAEKDGFIRAEVHDESGANKAKL